jgi:hypothetical protein
MVGSNQIVEWLRAHVAPTPDLCGCNAFRCSAYLTDGLYLPCVLVREASAHVRLAMDRFEESRRSGISDPRNIKPGHYPTIVSSFVTHGNFVRIADVARVEASPFAIPATRLFEIEGETAMSWTAFAAIMDDGREYSFGTTWSTDFFSMPDGYSAERVRQIVPHRNVEQPVYRERPFFECFVEGIAFGEWSRSA